MYNDDLSANRRWMLDGGGRRFFVIHGSSFDNRCELMSVSDEPVSISIEVGIPPMFP